MRNLNAFWSAIAAFALTTAAFAAQAFAEETETTAQSSETLFEGVWTKKSFKAAGAWEISQKDGQLFVSLSDDFKTRKAPDLKIFLSPLAAADVTGKNATEGSVLISPLESNKGAQSYPLPAEIDLAQFKSIIIHCEQYSKLWSAADLK